MTTTPERADVLTPAQVAQMLGVDPKTVTRWAKSGRLEFLWTPGGHRRYNRDEVESFLTFRRAGDAK